LYPKTELFDQVYVGHKTYNYYLNSWQMQLPSSEYYSDVYGIMYGSIWDHILVKIGY